MNFLQSIYLSYFSSPAENRGLYQTVKRLKPLRIVEFGIQKGQRSFNLLRLASHFRKAEQIEYYCVDPFEGRMVEDGPGLSLRKAYKMLARTGVPVRMVPGLPEEGLRSFRDSLFNVDLVVIATPSLDWIRSNPFPLCDMMNPGGAVFVGVSPASGEPFELSFMSVEQLRQGSFSSLLPNHYRSAG